MTPNSNFHHQGLKNRLGNHAKAAEVLVDEGSQFFFMVVSIGPYLAVDRKLRSLFLLILRELLLYFYFLGWNRNIWRKLKSC